MHHSRLIRWLAIATSALAVAVGVRLYFRQPDELEASILGDLAVRAHVDESARATVLKRIKLFDAASHRLDYATVLIRDDSGHRLAHLKRLAQHPSDAGGRWSTVYDRWRTFDHRPTTAEIKQFDASDEDSLKYLFVKGWLPRPPGEENFRASRLFIRVSPPIPGFEPNQGIDAARYAAIMLRTQGHAGGRWLGELTFAPFHEPRWISPADGLEAVEGSIQFHESKMERARDTEERLSFQRDLELLHTVQECLHTLQKHGRTFYLLAQDESLSQEKDKIASPSAPLP
jgi:hypothetical protein